MRIGECTFEDQILIKPGESKIVFLPTALLTDSLNYSLDYVVIPKANNCKYFGIILYNDLIWSDQVNYMVKNVQKELYFKLYILKTGNSSTKILAHTSLVRSILEYASSFWDPCREI
jgi:hypothetical protein